MTLSGVTNAEVLPSLLKQTRRAIKEISGDGAYDTRECHRAIRVKKATPLIPPHEGAAFWGKGIRVTWQLAAKNSTARTKSGNRSMVTISGHCQRPRCIA
ncbi:transposase [Vibrio sp. McD22-P3]|uniref:transposase n=1 Tax=Vibrio sp. McD22-P3 TaxID=2724880 RepID=UPI003FCC4787